MRREGKHTDVPLSRRVVRDRTEIHHAHAARPNCSPRTDRAHDTGEGLPSRRVRPVRRCLFAEYPSVRPLGTSSAEIRLEKHSGPAFSVHWQRNILVGSKRLLPCAVYFRNRSQNGRAKRLTASIFTVRDDGTRPRRRAPQGARTNGSRATRRVLEPRAALTPRA